MKIIVTGAAGFIGSCLVRALNERGEKDIILVDDLGSDERWKNLRKCTFETLLSIKEFEDALLAGTLESADALFHMGACSDTSEKNADYLLVNNTEYTKKIVEWCVKKNVRCIIASSAATYGDGENGFDDADEKISSLLPLNPYGYSKLLVDQWLIRKGFHKKVASLRFFNVYGPNEYHKGEMQSVAKKGFEQIKATQTMQLFQSHSSQYVNGEQQRDFIYVKDAIKVMLFLQKNQSINGIFNVGTGVPRSWNDLARALFSVMSVPERISYVPMPQQTREHYQYFTCAGMGKLRSAGYAEAFTTLEEGIRDYVQNYLATDDQFF